MLFPYPVIDPLGPGQVETWKAHFAGRAHERPRCIEEGIWRRTQEPQNAAASGWSPEESGRRRMVHYNYRYRLDTVHPMPRLVLDQFYLYHSLTGPKADIEAFLRRVEGWLTEGGWRRRGAAWARGDLRCRITAADEHPEDVRAGRPNPPGFSSMEAVFTSVGARIPRQVRHLPWDVLAWGVRRRERRGTPQYAPDLSGLADYLPFQVELGCGTSIEAGIPPLHYLHEVYRVTDRRKDAPSSGRRFILRPQDDPLLGELLVTPGKKFPELVAMFKAAVEAEPTPAHRALKALNDAGKMVGPVINHNFDILAGRTGLEECFVRRYDQKAPPVPLLDGARALLVIGLHADRRAVQARARARGMKVFFLDLEAVPDGGVLRRYPVEGAREGDVVVRREATPALLELCDRLGVAVPGEHAPTIGHRL
ncbi:hypothetical protein [Nocardiopsis composta]|uniref:Uncharacterized protein n=1 Tax=Nocardiopsis composta TaxID=157465 RepID=A0A7W8VG75_9ACTN|nr:hypothetical protein [Nocardiopsis composta]MBB5435162.1 hypothetical protein [Nocardiopsis composta]